MTEVDELVEELFTHNLKIAFIVNQIENKYPGKTLGELIVESIFDHFILFLNRDKGLCSLLFCFFVLVSREFHVYIATYTKQRAPN